MFPRKPLAQHGQRTCAPLLDWNIYAILSTFPGNDHSKWVMKAMPTLHYITPNTYTWGQKENDCGLILWFKMKTDVFKPTFSFRYSIDWKTDLDSYFDIDPVEGTISTNELLDRENIAQHNISVVATKLSKYANEIRYDARRCHCPLKDLMHVYSSQYSIPSCWKAL